MSTYTIHRCIKRQIAEAFLLSNNEDWFAVDTDDDNDFDAVMFRGPDATWNPWPHDARAVPVVDLLGGYIPDGSQVKEVAVALAMCEIPDRFSPTGGRFQAGQEVYDIRQGWSGVVIADNKDGTYDLLSGAGVLGYEESLIPLEEWRRRKESAQKNAPTWDELMKMD